MVTKMKYNVYQIQAVMRRRCETYICSLVGADGAAAWWNTTNREFGGLTANQQWNSDPDVVYKYLLGYVDYTC